MFHAAPNAQHRLRVRPIPKGEMHELVPTAKVPLALDPPLPGPGIFLQDLGVSIHLHVRMGGEKRPRDTQARQGLVTAVLPVSDEVPPFLRLKINDTQHEAARMVWQHALEQLQICAPKTLEVERALQIQHRSHGAPTIRRDAGCGGCGALANERHGNPDAGVICHRCARQGAGHTAPELVPLLSGTLVVQVVLPIAPTVHRAYHRRVKESPRRPHPESACVPRFRARSNHSPHPKNRPYELKTLQKTPRLLDGAGTFRHDARRADRPRALRCCQALGDDQVGGIQRDRLQHQTDRAGARSADDDGQSRATRNLRSGPTFGSARHAADGGGIAG